MSHWIQELRDNAAPRDEKAALLRTYIATCVTMAKAEISKAQDAAREYQLYEPCGNSVLEELDTLYTMLDGDFIVRCLREPVHPYQLRLIERNRTAAHRTGSAVWRLREVDGVGLSHRVTRPVPDTDSSTGGES